MDKFVTACKPSTSRATVNEKQKQRPSFKYNPYGVRKANERKFEEWKDLKRADKTIAPLTKQGPSTKPSSAAVTKHLLNTLSEESNPITHSDIYQRSDHISSAATGHQRSDGGRANQKEYMESRSKKLKDQLPDKLAGPDGRILQGVCVYINGYLEDTTDIEMKRIVTLAGGQAMLTASGATHILTSQQLSGSKTHKLLTTKTKIKVHVVRPEWVIDSIEAKTRLPERDYSVIKNNAVADLATMFAAGSSRDAPIELS